ncbi:MAG: N-acetylglucosamine-6-phosphate deacetylase [Planctomycetota bacterium]|jgi:N-acetylglucosamine-6-phosphate deacetylase
MTDYQPTNKISAIVRGRLMPVPGLVDLQVNGYKGTDFSDPNLTEEAFVDTCREVLVAGTTAFLPTLITSSTEVYQRNLSIIAKAMNLAEFENRLLGIHLEGPFLSTKEGARGAHNPAWMKAPDPALLNQFMAWAGGKVRLLTLAADLEGAEALTGWATSRGITVSLGHQMAGEQQLEHLARAGAKALTHLGNGIPAMIPRHGNPVWAGLANDELCATFIPDGHHLPASLIKTIVRVKGPERCIVISDTSALAGMPPGEYNSMGIRVVLEDNGLLHDPTTGYMAGSSATMFTCANHLASLDLVTNRELVAMVFDNPLKLIGIRPRQIHGESGILFDGQRRRFLRETEV